MRRWGAGAVRKRPTPGAVLRRLRHDLGPAAVDPLTPGARIWMPLFVLLLLLLALSLGTYDSNVLAQERGLDSWLGVLLGIVPAAALLVALYQPSLAWWAVTADTLVVAFAGQLPDPGLLFPWTPAGLTAQAVVLFLLALRVPVRVAAEVLAVTGLLLGAAFLAVGPAGSGGLWGALGALLAAAVLGAALRGLRTARTELVAQEELTAEERARRTLLEERSRIARELHDVVAHHMSVISIQAQVAPHLVEEPSEALRENLAGIRANAVDALTELRRVLGVLRAEEAGSEAAAHAPQPTLDRLDELVRNVRAAGLTVTLRTLGEPGPVSPGVGLSAYRIVQEALSNAMRHAPGAGVEVTVGHHPGAVTVRVLNTAPTRGTRRPPGVGHGLLGMRERAAMLGGELATGPTGDGGWEVAATLPADPPATPAPFTPAAGSAEDTR